MALIYLSVLTAGSFLIMVWMKYLRWRDAWEYKNAIGDVKDVLEFVIGLVFLIIDALKDTIKYVLYAAIIAAISLWVYFKGLRQPERWTSFSLLIVGIALVWIAAAPSEELAAFYTGAGVIVQYTIGLIGHLYVVTSLVQFVHALSNKYYFLEDREEQDNILWQQRSAELEKRIEQQIAEKHQDTEFDRFMNWGFSKDQKEELLNRIRYLVLYWNFLLAGQISDRQINQILDAAWKTWYDEPRAGHEAALKVIAAVPDYRTGLLLLYKKTPSSTWTMDLKRAFFGARPVPRPEATTKEIQGLIRQHVLYLLRSRLPKRLGGVWDENSYYYRPQPIHYFYEDLNEEERERYISVCSRYAAAWNELLVDRVLTDDEIEKCLDVVRKNWGETLWQDEDTKEPGDLFYEYANAFYAKKKRDEEMRKSDRLARRNAILGILASVILAGGFIYAASTAPPPVPAAVVTPAAGSAGGGYQMYVCVGLIVVFAFIIFFMSLDPQQN